MRTGLDNLGRPSIFFGADGESYPQCERRGTAVGVLSATRKSISVDRIAEMVFGSIEYRGVILEELRSAQIAGDVMDIGGGEWVSVSSTTGDSTP